MASRCVNSIISGYRTRFDYAIEASWLSALLLVPIAFSGPDIVVFFLQPKDLILHFAALLIVALWAFEWALGGYPLRVDLGSWATIRSWLGRNPRNWALLAGAGFGISAFLSTLLSQSPELSLWGRNFAELGFELYSILSFLVIFFAIALRVRGGDQVRRILWVIAAAGAITGMYGISQRFGWDPIGNGSDQARVISSFGNPIFFGSYLVMSIVVTIGVGLDEARKADRWWLPLIAALLGIQLAAMWFTGSRGPWVGLVFGVAAFSLMGAITLSRSAAIRSGVLVISGLLIAVLIANLPGDAGQGESRGLGSIVSGVTPSTGGFGGRVEIWQTSGRLLKSWDRQVDESAAAAALRPVFGLGPEMYYYSYPLEAGPQRGVTVSSQTHNLPLQIVLELGIVGLGTFVALAIAVLAAGIGLLRKRGRTDDWLAIAILAVVASLIGRAVEQMAGVPRMGDLVPFWGLIGVALAIYAIGHRSGSEFPSGVLTRRLRVAWIPMGAAVVVSVISLAIFVSRDVQMLRSGLIAADAFEESASGNRDESIRLLKKAADISPEVQNYHVWAGELLVREAQAQTDRTLALNLFGEAHNTFIKYERRDPIAFATQLRIGRAAAELVNLGDNFRRDELMTRSLRTANAMPSYLEIQGVMAERLLLAGDLEEGLKQADRAIAMESATEPQPFAWFMRGNALGDLGDTEGALEAFNTALDREPEGRFAPGVHRSLALVFDSIGDAAQAQVHRALADQIQTNLDAAENG